MATNQLTWREAIMQVLRDAGRPLHYREITEEIIKRKLRTKLGATPAATVNAQLAVGAKEVDSAFPVSRVGRGLFAVRPSGPVAKEPPVPVEEPGDDEDQYDVVTSFGMYWRRDLVRWTTSAKLLGMQQTESEPVDFAAQTGLYLLYDGREVVYVGRSTDRPLGRRLYEHTQDRLATRWDRFSWFGFRPISDTGALGDLPSGFAGEKIAPAIEAILIEALEPRQNRRRGDDLSAVEFIQKEDPEIAKQKLKAGLDDLLRSR